MEITLVLDEGERIVALARLTAIDSDEGPVAVGIEPHRGHKIRTVEVPAGLERASSLEELHEALLKYPLDSLVEVRPSEAQSD